jgi:hypothetical protein
LEPEGRGNAQVTTTWTGEGDLVDASPNSVVNVPPCFTVQHHNGDVSRWASATGSFAGRDLGAPEVAQLLRLKQGDVFVDHTPQGPRPLCLPPPPP